MGFTDQFIASNQTARELAAERERWWVAFRLTQDPPIRAALADALVEAVRGLIELNTPSRRISVATEENVLQVEGWFLHAGLSGQQYILTTGATIEKFTHGPTTSGNPWGYHQMLEGDPAALPEDAFVLSPQGKLLVFTRDSDGSAGWTLFQDWLLTQMRAVVAAGFFPHDFPSSIAPGFWDEAFEWATRGQVRQKLLRPPHHSRCLD